MEVWVYCSIPSLALIGKEGWAQVYMSPLNIFAQNCGFPSLEWKVI